MCHTDFSRSIVDRYSRFVKGVLVLNVGIQIIDGNW